MAITDQIIDGNDRAQTALAEPVSEFSDYNNFEEFEEYRDGSDGDFEFEGDEGSEFDTVEEIDIDGRLVGHDDLPSEASPEKVGSFVEESSVVVAEVEAEADAESENYADYVPEGLELDDESDYFDFEESEAAVIAEPVAEAELSSDFEDYEPEEAIGSEFEDIDEFDYQPSLDSDNGDEDAAAIELDAELDSDEDGDEEESDEESGYDPDVEEEEADDFVDPRRSKSKVPLSGKPLMKAAFIGAAGLVVVLFGGSLYSLLTSGGEVKDQAATNLEPTTLEPALAELPESGKLKAELAFSSQQNDLEKAQRLKAGQAQPSPTPSTTPPPQAQDSAVAPEPLPLPLPLPLPIPAPTMPEMTAAPAVDPYADLSPIERWQAIASMGSFGRANPSARPATVAAAPAAPAAPVVPVAPARPAASASGLSGIRSGSTTPGMRSVPLADVLVGTTASGTMTTAVVLGGDNAEAVNPTAPNAVKYLVTLSSPIKDATGATAIPAGATLVSVVSGFSTQTGMMQLMVKSVLYNNKEYAAPDGAILIRGEDGASLRASRTGGGNPIISAILPAVLQGAAGAAGALTQNQGTTVTNGNVTTTTSSSSPNVTAGFVQGASQALAQQITQATQSANASAQGQPQSWKLSEGKGVQVFVNSTFQM